MTNKAEEKKALLIDKYPSPPLDSACPPTLRLWRKSSPASISPGCRRKTCWTMNRRISYGAVLAHGNFARLMATG